MTAAVENLITSLRKKNAEEEAKIVADKKKQLADEKKRSDALYRQEQKSAQAIEDFKNSLKRGKKTKAMK